MSLDNLFTGSITIGGELFDPLYYCVSGFLSYKFKSDYIRIHTYSSLPHLHWSRAKLIPLRYVVMYGYFLDT